MSDNILLPGFRFYPTEEELISFYLLHKIQGKQFDTVIPLVHIYDYNPWDLPRYAGELCRGDPEQWFFFLPKQEREGRGGRPNRLTTGGYWKATGSPGDVYSSSGSVIGRKRTMVFYMGRAPKGTKTTWKMNEYKAIDQLGQAASSSTNPPLSEEFSVCRVYKQSKSLRSFDRRPTEAAEGGQPAMHHQQHDHDNEAPSTSEQNYIAASDHAINARSYTSPPSEEHAANSDSNVALDSEALWDLEQFDKWFD